MGKPKYTVDQLRHLVKIRTSKMDDCSDDHYISEKLEFEYNTDKFFDWLDKMESKGKISELLNFKFKS